MRLDGDLKPNCHDNDGAKSGQILITSERICLPDPHAYVQEFLDFILYPLGD